MIDRTTRFVILALATNMVIAPLLVAQNRRPNRPGNAAAQPAEETKPETISFRQHRLNTLDDELAALLQRRGEAGLDPIMLELQIDLRLLTRQVVANGLPDKLEAKPEIIAAYHRQRQLTDLATMLAENVKAIPANQAASLNKIRDLTYRNLDAKTVANLDTFAREVAVSVVPLMPNVPTTAMRPAKVAATTRPGATADPLILLVTSAQRANVTPALRRQLLALADATTSTEDAAEKRALTIGLSDAVDLANGLATNTAVEMETRTQIETQLAQGLALFTDPRTREIGRSRLKVFAPYRQTMARVGKLRENPDTQKFAKLFSWAQQRGDEGAKALSAVEAYNEVVAAFDAREAPLPSALPPNVRKAAQSLEQQFANARATFIDSAMQIGNGGIMAPPVKQLDDDVNAMRDAMNRLGMAERSPSTVDTLLAYKPRPVGSIEKRVILALLAVSNEPTAKMPMDEAVGLLTTLDTLANLSRRIGAADLVTATTGAEAWAGQGVEPLARSVTGTFTTALNGLSVPTGTVEPAVLDQLKVTAEVCELLREAVAIDKAAGSLAPLERWADWGVTASQLEGVLKPFRDSVAITVDGLVSNSPGAGEQWPRVNRRYRPVVAYLQDMTAYAPGCAALPNGPAAVIAQLATPLDERSFTEIRTVGGLLGLWGTAELSADITTAEETAGLVGRVVGRRN